VNNVLLVGLHELLRTLVPIALSDTRISWK